MPVIVGVHARYDNDDHEFPDRHGFVSVYDLDDTSNPHGKTETWSLNANGVKHNSSYDQTQDSGELESLYMRVDKDMDTVRGEIQDHVAGTGSFHANDNNCAHFAAEVAQKTADVDLNAEKHNEVLQCNVGHAAALGESIVHERGLSPEPELPDNHAFKAPEPIESAGEQEQVRASLAEDAAAIATKARSDDPGKSIEEEPLGKVEDFDMEP